MSLSIIKLTIVVAAVIGVLDCHYLFGKGPQRLDEINDDSRNFYTPPQCHSPYEYDGPDGLIIIPGYSSRPLIDIDTKLVGWYYNVFHGACKPLYLQLNVPPFEGNADLPTSKHECEMICGLKCIYEESGDINERYKEGVCSYDEYCMGGSLPGSFGTCGKAFSVNCCQKNFTSSIKPIPSLMKYNDK